MKQKQNSMYLNFNNHIEMIEQTNKRCLISFYYLFLISLKVYCSYKKQTFQNSQQGLPTRININLFCSNRVNLSYMFSLVQKNIFFSLCTLLPSNASCLPGGSPYPDINARKIAQKLQEGYRMPKPKHVEIKL